MPDDSDDAAMLRVQEIVREALANPGVVLTRATTAKDVAGWDSIKQVMIILEVEQAFGITLRSREIDRIMCVGDLVDVVRSKVAG